MANINIGDVHKDDAFYRYKMPIMDIVVEGRGNGVKTKINNIDAVAKALDRPSCMIMRCMSASLGTSTNANVLRGHHTPKTLTTVLSKFIDEYVLCSNCTNPETTMRLNTSHDKIKFTCKACGIHYKKSFDTPYIDVVIKCLK